MSNIGERIKSICDVFLKGIGAISLENGKFVAFESHKLSSTMKNYT